MKNLLTIFNTVLINNDLPQIDQLIPETALMKDLELDSIMLAELTVRIEDEYDIDVYENGMVHTVGDILDILEKQLSQ